jgi:hypothetical protein
MLSSKANLLRRPVSKDLREGSEASVVMRKRRQEQQSSKDTDSEEKAEWMLCIDCDC